MIKLKCKQCGYSFEVSEKEFNENIVLYRFCILNDGGQLEIVNVKDYINYDLERKVKDNLDRWFKELGIEGTIELIERNKNQACARLYVDELRKRGLVK